MKTEPATIIGLIGTLLGAVLTLLVAFSVDLTGDQQTAILGAWAALAPIVTALFVRGKVTPA
jgi:hypothetical protein